jgi:hypothetical protein
MGTCVHADIETTASYRREMTKLLVLVALAGCGKDEAAEKAKAAAAAQQAELAREAIVAAAKRQEAARAPTAAADAAEEQPNLPTKELDVTKVLGQPIAAVDKLLGKFNLQDDGAHLYEEFDPTAVQAWPHGGRVAMVQIETAGFHATQGKAIAAWAHGEAATLVVDEQHIELWVADEKTQHDMRKADVQAINAGMREDEVANRPSVGLDGIAVLHVGTAHECGTGDLALVRDAARRHGVQLKAHGFEALECISSADRPPRLNL